MKLPDKNSMGKWIAEAGAYDTPHELLRYLVKNKERVEAYISGIDGNQMLYRTSNRMFSFFAKLAEAADRLSFSVQLFLWKIPHAKQFIEKFRGWKNNLNFRELIEFGQTKLYSLKRPPHNEKAIQVVEEVMEFCEKHGLDINAHFPNAMQQLREKKKQLLQHKFFREFSKSRLEQLLAIPFHFDRCIFPVLPDSAFWHKFFDSRERSKLIDLLLYSRNGDRVSLRYDPKKRVRSSEVVRILQKISGIKEKGGRIFFVGHHEGYLGPYFVRSAIRKLGFDNLARNCNTIVGPRMLSNVVLRNGAANVGNLFLTLPSQKTTKIRTDGLAEALRKTARKTQFLIKLPSAGLKLIENLDYEAFVDTVKKLESGADAGKISLLDPSNPKTVELIDFLKASNSADVLKDFKPEDFYLFKSIMYESFLIFPEGSRSQIGPSGEVIMKYVNPKFLKAYMRPGDFVVPVSLAGGADLTRGWRLRPARLGLCLGDPFEVTSDMIENYEEAGFNVMREIAALPNLKKVVFNQGV